MSESGVIIIFLENDIVADTTYEIFKLIRCVPMNVYQKLACFYPKKKLTFAPAFLPDDVFLFLSLDPLPSPVGGTKFLAWITECGVLILILL